MAKQIFAAVVSWSIASCSTTYTVGKDAVIGGAVGGGVGAAVGP